MKPYILTHEDLELLRVAAGDNPRLLEIVELLRQGDSVWYIGDLAFTKHD